MLSKEEKKTIIELRTHYRNCFDSPSGRIVLTDILRRCLFFNDDLTADYPEGVGKRNLGTEICGILGSADDPFATISAMMEGLMKVPITTQNLTDE